MSDTPNPAPLRPGALVRAVTNAGNGLARAVYALVLNVSAPNPDAGDLGENGEPTLTIAFIDGADVRKLGSVDWHSGLTRQFGVRHASNADVKQAKTGVCWLDVLAAPDDGIDVKTIFTDTEAEPSPNTPPTYYTPPVSIGVGRVLSVHIEGEEGNHNPDSMVQVDGQMKKLTDLQPGMVIESLEGKPTITSIRKTNEGQLVIGTGDQSLQGAGAGVLAALPVEGKPAELSDGDKVALLATEPHIEEKPDGTFDVVHDGKVTGNYATWALAASEPSYTSFWGSQDFSAPGDAYGISAYTEQGFHETGKLPTPKQASDAVPADAGKNPGPPDFDATTATS
jgi:hypothetical protein